MTEAILIVIGLAVGSFMNVVIARLPQGKSLAYPPSSCPECGQNILPRDNIPILSFILLKGRCRSCKKPISPQYPMVEAVTASLFLMFYYKYGLSFEYLAALVIVMVSVPVFVIDLKTFLIPDKLIFPGFTAGILLLILPAVTGQGLMPLIGKAGWLWSVSGFLAGGASLYLLAVASPLIFKKEGMGGGDIKLAAFFGMFLGMYVMEGLFFSFFLGSIGGAAMMMTQKKDKATEIPFGPYIIAGMFITLIFGEKLFELYLKWSGY